MSQPEPEATPEQQEAVRRLLADARHTDPMPSDVAARLDRVLAQLAATEPPGAVAAPGPAASGSVVDLSARRRRTRAVQLLGAAAAVVVLGVGVTQVVGTGSGDDDSGTDASSAARDDAGDDGGSASNESAEDPNAPAVPAPSEVAPSTLPDRARLIDSADFTETVLRLRDAPAVISTSTGTALAADQLTQDPMFVCPTTVLGEGRLVPVSYAGRPSVLAYRTPAGETQTVELLQCGTGEVVRSVVIPAP